MFGYDNVKVLTVSIGDPGADRDICIFKAPCKLEIVSARAFDSVQLAASSANYYTLALYNGGTSGTALTSVAGTVGGTPASGTAPGWAAVQGTALPITGDGTLAEGEYLWVRYDETGTVASQISIELKYRLGVAA